MTTIAVCQCCGGMTFLGEQVCYICVMRPKNPTQPNAEQPVNSSETNQPAAVKGD